MYDDVSHKNTGDHMPGGAGVNDTTSSPQSFEEGRGVKISITLYMLVIVVK